MFLEFITSLSIPKDANVYHLATISGNRENPLDFFLIDQVDSPAFILAAIQHHRQTGRA